MSPEAQRIAIAEACEAITWTRLDKKSSDGRFMWKNEKGTVWHESFMVESLPNYVGDLNAMAEARKTLTTDTQRSRYFEALHQVVGIFGDNPQWAMIDASAKQHAEAFLKTIGEWKE